MRDRRNFNDAEKLDIVIKTKALMDAGIAKSIAPLQVAGVYWARIETWCLQTEDMWSVMYPGTPFPHHVHGESGRHKDRTNLLTWNQAVRMMREGMTIRPEESMLYRYSIEDDKLVEWRRNLGTFKWCKADEVTLNRYTFKQWMYEVVE
jgi:hypothetical protein